MSKVEEQFLSINCFIEKIFFFFLALPASSLDTCHLPSLDISVFTKYISYSSTSRPTSPPVNAYLAFETEQVILLHNEAFPFLSLFNSIVTLCGFTLPISDTTLKITSQNLALLNFMTSFSRSSPYFYSVLLVPLILSLRSHSQSNIYSAQAELSSSSITT